MISGVSTVRQYTCIFCTTYFMVFLDCVFISGHLEVNVEFLIQIDKLVQLIESPIFTCE